MARSLVTQLWIRKEQALNPVENLHKTYFEGREQPMTEELINTLLSISKPSSAGRVFIITR